MMPFAIMMAKWHCRWSSALDEREGNYCLVLQPESIRTYSPLIAWHLLLLAFTCLALDLTLKQVEAGQGAACAVYCSHYLLQLDVPMSSVHWEC